MQYRFLSYPINNKMPVYGQLNCDLNISPVKALKKGDSCNVFTFVMENHWGTHIDCPAHFFENGLKVVDYSPETWFFDCPFVIKLNLKENQLISPENIGHIPNGTDLLLIKSYFYNYRGTKRYSNNNPGFIPETGIWLRKKYPNIKAIGFDFISLSPYQNREIGRKAHQSFLNPDGENSPILIIEDMDLSPDLSGLKQVLAFPLRIEGIDSAPCTIIGVFE